MIYLQKRNIIKKIKNKKKMTKKNIKKIIVKLSRR